MAKRIKLIESHHVIRNVGSRKYRKVGDEIIFFPAAFRLRLKSEFQPPRMEDENYISASWLEYFDGSTLVRLKKIITIIKRVRGLNKSTALVVLNVGKIIKCGEKLNASLTAWNEPKKGNPVYAAVRGMRKEHQENDRLPMLILSEAVTETFIVSDF